MSSLNYKLVWPFHLYDGAWLKFKFFLCSRGRGVSMTKRVRPRKTAVALWACLLWDILASIT